MSIFKNVHDIIKKQETKGKTKYGMEIDNANFTPIEWIQNAQEEAADLMVYLEKLKEEWNSKGIVGTIKTISDNRTTAQIERELLGELLTNLQFLAIQTNGNLSFVDIINEIENMIEETEQ